ncbi:unnamed protein product [Peronospora farinosa]|uniref:Uncharacterized protein n=2 Tax=Peronospora farinosa TaxID=134698 RepID=A0ABN8C169_9STRA|nr:unnamed protein product [Peronospora farinosa]
MMDEEEYHGELLELAADLGRRLDLIGSTIDVRSRQVDARPWESWSGTGLVLRVFAEIPPDVQYDGGKNKARARRVSALQAFWPGLQVLVGDVSGAIRTHKHRFQLWDDFGAMPELLDLAPRGKSKPGNRGTVISWTRTSRAD